MSLPSIEAPTPFHRPEECEKGAFPRDFCRRLGGVYGRAALVDKKFQSACLATCF
jgi:hypothetical protein